MPTLSLSFLSQSAAAFKEDRKDRFRRRDAKNENPEPRVVPARATLRSVADPAVVFPSACHWSQDQSFLFLQNATVTSAS